MRFRTTTILAALTALLASQSASTGVAQEERAPDAGIERAPQAGRLFRMEDQFTVVLPEGWAVYDQTAALSRMPSPFGLVYFSAEPLPSPGEKTLKPDDFPRFQRVDSGDVPSFFVDRHPAGKGMSCSRLTRGARLEIEQMVARDSIFGGLARQMLLPKRPQTSPVELAGCQALKLEGRGRIGPENAEWMMDVRAVSDGKTLYLFALRNTADNFARNGDAFEAALATLRLAATTAAPALASGSSGSPGQNEVTP